MKFKYKFSPRYQFHLSPKFYLTPTNQQSTKKTKKLPQNKKKKFSINFNKNIKNINKLCQNFYKTNKFYFKLTENPL